VNRERALSSRRDVWLLFFGALFVRLAVCVWAWDVVPPTADGSFYHVVAQRIAAGLGYTWLWPDGAVTYAAHYPVGYPTIMGALYALFGPIPGAVMVFNAAIGSLAIVATYGICWRTIHATAWKASARQASLLVCAWLALSPTLVGYTPALMTEGAVGAFVIFAARCSIAWQEREQRDWVRWAALFAMITCLAMATYLRPQSVLLAPVVALLMVRRGFGGRLLAVTTVSLACAALSSRMPADLPSCASADPVPAIASPTDTAVKIVRDIVVSPTCADSVDPAPMSGEHADGLPAYVIDVARGQLVRERTVTVPRDWERYSLGVIS
jgi:hypothetical protein